MRFIHISDIHFNPDSAGRSTRDLQEKFKAYVGDKKITDIDEVFFTGDFQHAGEQAGQNQNEVAEKAVHFLCCARHGTNH